MQPLCKHPKACACVMCLDSLLYFLRNHTSCCIKTIHIRPLVSLGYFRTKSLGGSCIRVYWYFHGFDTRPKVPAGQNRIIHHAEILGVFWTYANSGEDGRKAATYWRWFWWFHGFDDSELIWAVVIDEQQICKQSGHFLNCLGIRITVVLMAKLTKLYSPYFLCKLPWQCLSRRNRPACWWCS